MFGIMKATGIFSIMMYLFYESAYPALFLFPIWILLLKEWIGDTLRKKEQEFRNQFRDSIQSMASALKAGYSVENAIRETKKDILPMYGKDTRIIKEYSVMIRQLDMNRTAVQVLEDFSDRVNQEDVQNFVNVFTAAKKSGGDSISIIRNATRVISEKIDTEREIQSMLASKKMEFEIMCIVPFGIILYMKMTFSEFLDILYNSFAGTVTMTGCLAAYLAAYWFGRKMIRIEV